jgi:hypothetical protein
MLKSKAPEYPKFNTQTLELRRRIATVIDAIALTTRSAQRKTSYSQILKLLLFVFVIRGLPRGFSFSKNLLVAGSI